MTRGEYAKGKRQRDFKRVLCVCTGGLLRSATAAVILSRDPYGYNTRAVGTDPRALIIVDTVMIEWADEVVCMTMAHIRVVRALAPGFNGHCLVLGIEDDYEYRDPRLIDLIRQRYDAAAQQ